MKKNGGRRREMATEGMREIEIPVIFASNDDDDGGSNGGDGDDADVGVHTTQTLTHVH